VTSLLRVCHVSPTYFAPESVLGGGERFAEELARAMATRASVKFVSFGPRAVHERPAPNYERVILKNWTRRKLEPFSPRLFAELRGAEVVHCYQYFSLPTFIACWAGHRQESRVFVSDLGGGGWTPGYQIDQSRWITAQLPISAYAAAPLARAGRRHHVIYGGVDLARFPARPQETHDGSVVFLGRILPHKGIHFLIEALPPGMQLHVLGSVVDLGYFHRLQALAGGKRVDFHTGLTDAQIVPFLQRAMALVHPTPVDHEGNAGVNELFGLALVEAMACGCPVIATAAASLTEIVEDNLNGLVVPPNDPGAIRAVMCQLAQDDGRWRQLSTRARASVESRFSWNHVVQRCLTAYRDEPRLAGGRTAPSDPELLPSPRP
jgi:glycosyltransferase involved in cell wall biosynthesis